MIQILGPASGRTCLFFFSPLVCNPFGFLTCWVASSSRAFGKLVLVGQPPFFRSFEKISFWFRSVLPTVPFVFPLFVRSRSKRLEMLKVFFPLRRLFFFWGPGPPLRLAGTSLLSPRLFSARWPKDLSSPPPRRARPPPSPVKPRSEDLSPKLSSFLHKSVPSFCSKSRRI